MKQKEIEQLLPIVFRRTIRQGELLSALLQVMEDLHAPSEAILERLDDAFNPWRTPDNFVPFLARWVDLDRLFDERPSGTGTDLSTEYLTTFSLGYLRELIAAAAYLSQWRGTAKGLILFLETATGVQGFEIYESGPFHIHVRSPEKLRPHSSLIKRIIDSEKPACVTYELDFRATN